MVDQWKHRFETRPGRTGMRVVIVITLFILFVIAGVWVLYVVTAPIRGTGDAYAQRSSAGNWITAQKQFQSDVKTFEARKVQIADASRALTAWRAGPHPADGIAAYTDAEHGRNLEVTLTGLTTGCQNIAAGYNTDSRAYLSQQFKDADLPDQLDPAACTATATP